MIRGGRTPSFPSRGEIHHLDAAAGEESALYAWMSSVDPLRRRIRERTRQGPQEGHACVVPTRRLSS